MISFKIKTVNLIMDIEVQNKKIELIQWMSTLNDEFILDKLMEFREKDKRDWWKEISEEEKKSIKKGINDSNSGNLKPHAEAKKVYEKWL
ncbi:hypothetical protein RBU60_03980 [Mesonia sp. MT50]|uniref:Addiction module protein n=1 Tax=Mesonia profundi TaxID=3070998 RepID=A0ABU1A164_9FLAO|nr:hypothetical protein [Mesonia profundi]MDQ7916723.1 hypothetical protein [Mesonia profundi]